MHPSHDPTITHMEAAVRESSQKKMYYYCFFFFKIVLFISFNIFFSYIMYIFHSTVYIPETALLLKGRLVFVALLYKRMEIY